MSKQEFLDNFRVAKNLFSHPHVEITGSSADPLAQQQVSARAAIWLTPRSVKGFNPDDFRELPPGLHAELQTAIADFLEVAKQIPPSEAASPEQLAKATAAFAKALSILQRYVPTPQEGEVIEATVKNVLFPSWIVNWDYQLGNNGDDEPAVWINLFADERTAPRSEFGRLISQLTMKFQSALSEAGSDRWPYVRLRTAKEHKTA